MSRSVCVLAGVGLFLSLYLFVVSSVQLADENCVRSAWRHGVNASCTVVHVTSTTRQATFRFTSENVTYAQTLNKAGLDYFPGETVECKLQHRCGAIHEPNTPMRAWSIVFLVISIVCTFSILLFVYVDLIGNNVY